MPRPGHARDRGICFRRGIKTRAEKLPPEISIFIALLSAGKRRWCRRRCAFPESSSSIFGVQIVGARLPVFRLLILRPLTNSITTWAVIARANGSERFSPGSRLRLHAPRIMRLRGCISQSADKRAPRIFDVYHEIFTRSLSKKRWVVQRPLASYRER